MLKFSKATTIALNAMLQLARVDGTSLSTSELATRLEITPHHLAKVLQQLARHNLIESTRGPGGGHRLMGQPKNITLMDIIAVFEMGRQERNGAEIQKTPANNSKQQTSALHRVFDEIDEQVCFTLKSISLKTLMAM